MSGLQARDHRDRFLPVAGLARDLQVGLRVDEHADAAAEQRLIVDECDADHRASQGISARTVKRSAE